MCSTQPEAIRGTGIYDQIARIYEKNRLTIIYHVLVKGTVETCQEVMKYSDISLEIHHRRQLFRRSLMQTEGTNMFYK